MPSRLTENVANVANVTIMNNDFEHLSELSINENMPELWNICEDETINWKELARIHLRNFIPSFRYDGYLYCLSLLHKKLFRERELVREEGEYTDEDKEIYKIGLLSRRYRQSLNEDIILQEQNARRVYTIYPNSNPNIGNVSEAA